MLRVNRVIVLLCMGQDTLFSHTSSNCTDSSWSEEVERLEAHEIYLVVGGLNLERGRSWPPLTI